MNGRHEVDCVNRIDGERIAKRVVRREEALGVLKERAPLFSWLDGLGLVAAVCIGMELGTLNGDFHWLASGAGGIGFYLAMLAYVECLRLRRRLNAAIALIETAPSP